MNETVEVCASIPWIALVGITALTRRSPSESGFQCSVCRRTGYLDATPSNHAAHSAMTERHRMPRCRLRDHRNRRTIISFCEVWGDRCEDERWDRYDDFGLQFSIYALTIVPGVHHRHVQHLPGNVACLGQVNNGVHEVADAGDYTHRRERLQEVLRVVHVHGSVNTPIELAVSRHQMSLMELHHFLIIATESLSRAALT
jgi:hypothetical protein